MSKPTSFAIPAHASDSCRHYDYLPGLEGGPRCAIEIGNARTMVDGDHLRSGGSVRA